MSIGNRPFVGSWQLNNRTVVRQVPDGGMCDAIQVEGFRGRGIHW